jgi:hypothetical protein
MVPFDDRWTALWTGGGLLGAVLALVGLLIAAVGGWVAGLPARSRGPRRRLTGVSDPGVSVVVRSARRLGSARGTIRNGNARFLSPPAVITDRHRRPRLRVNSCDTRTFIFRAQ